LINYRLGDIRSPLLNNTEALSALINDFVECITNGKPTRVSGNDGLEVVKLLQATQESIKNKGMEIYL
jgi:predicted dehydrogenase